ncbi:unnamed protein product [Heterobilharzia americana]|nr:unnamed protein product [Heterobilharzia americana]
MTLDNQIFVDEFPRMMNLKHLSKMKLKLSVFQELLLGHSVVVLGSSPTRENMGGKNKENKQIRHYFQQISMKTSSSLNRFGSTHFIPTFAYSQGERVFTLRMVEHIS